ncbi:FecR family protein [Parabacteroides sp. 52]|uniref:FecR family protein n=1 Tax=unclassified Parabacteroides TaxID=2649774 RepID=UPI0013D71878|nr:MULTISPECIES: FecR family protein [unclassified Parabacteroides]MDH6533514.1 transmembrane sensor [Parabacteroides sp. PM5-20]NDV54267.1 FecR family protein [Parabacteroides sp. 52]
MIDIQIILLHYLDGTATKEEKEYFLKWLNHSKENQKEFQEIRDLWIHTHVSLATDTKTEKALKLFQKRILSDTTKKKISKKAFLLPFLRMTAMFILALGLNYLFFLKTDLPQEETEVIINRLITSVNSKGRFILPDSTVVWLNKNTTLEYPENFSSSVRRVKLEGEAYFEVSANPKAPFYVITDDLSVQVTGTSFVVQNYSNRQAVETILLKGKVFVGEEKKNLTELYPNQRYSLMKSSDTSQIDSVNGLNYIAWIEKRLAFDKRKLSDVIVQMEEWYGIDILCDPVFAQQTHVTFMIRDESIEEILSAIKMILPIKHEWRGETLYIQKSTL